MCEGCEPRQGGLRAPNSRRPWNDGQTPGRGPANACLTAAQMVSAGRPSYSFPTCGFWGKQLGTAPEKLLFPYHKKAGHFCSISLDSPLISDKYTFPNICSTACCFPHAQGYGTDRAPRVLCKQKARSGADAVSQDTHLLPRLTWTSSTKHSLKEAILLSPRA